MNRSTVYVEKEVNKERERTEKFLMHLSLVAITLASFCFIASVMALSITYPIITLSKIYNYTEAQRLISYPWKLHAKLIAAGTVAAFVCIMSMLFSRSLIYFQKHEAKPIRAFRILEVGLVVGLIISLAFILI